MSAYPNLKAEMARNGITQRELAKAIGKNPCYVSEKMLGKSEIALDVAISIKRAIGSNLTIEELFAKRG